MKKTINYIIIFIFFALIFGCSIKAKYDVKNGFFNVCKNNTVEKLIAGYLENPIWTAFVASDNNTYVEIKGFIKGSNNQLRVLVQFFVKDSEFEIKKIEINNAQQSNIEIENFVVRMCEFNSQRPEISNSQKNPSTNNSNKNKIVEVESKYSSRKEVENAILISIKDEIYAKELLDRLNESIVEGDNNVLTEIFEKEINFHGNGQTTISQIKRQIEAYKKRWKVNSNTITKIKFISSNKYLGLFHYFKDYCISSNNESAKTINFLIEGDVIIDFKSGKIISINDTKTLKL